MSFTCPPSELVSSILENLSFSGQNGVCLSDLWNSICLRFHFSQIDDFKKQVIWQWLFFCNEEPLQLYAIREGETLTILPIYEKFLKKEGTEDSIRILPTADTQWRYLTGLEPSKKSRLQLGEKPFELLCEISKHGSTGILAPELCKATGQDPRSLPMRFKKLQELGFIVRKSVYDENSRQHTSLCIHSKFLEQRQTDNLEDQAFRNAFKLRQYIVTSTKHAPNNLRSFKDLKKEVKMDKSKSSSKYFGAIVEFLHKNGYVEKLMVKTPEDDRLVYSVKYVKDLPKDIYDLADYVDVFSSMDPQEEDISISEDKSQVLMNDIPLFNNFLPLSNQVFEKISSSQQNGSTSYEIIRNFTGVSGYRPFTRLLDVLTSYVADESQLLPLKSYKNEYEKYSLVRSYDFEGKFKFYRYFITEVLNLPINDAKLKTLKVIPSLSNDLLELNEKYYEALGKTPKGGLFKSSSNKRAMDGTSRPSKKSKIDSEQSVHESRTRRIKKVNYKEISDDIDDESKGDLIRDTEYEALVEVDGLEPIEPQVHLEMHRSRTTSQKVIKTASLKSRRRRAQLIKIIQELGGVTYTTAKLRRMLDERLGNATATDIKTLARDISILITSKELTSQSITFTKSGKDITRKLLILTDDKYRPTKEEIEKTKLKCMEDNGDANKPQSRRIIEGEVSLYSITRTEKKKSSKSRRLDSLDEITVQGSKRRRRREPLKEDSTAPSATDENSDANLLPKLVSRKHRKRMKPDKTANEIKSSRLPRRFKSNFKFDKSDATTLFRAIVISKSFMKGSIDFKEIAALFDGMDAKTVKQKWTVVRKSVGGLPAVVKGMEAFEHIVIKGIDDELVSAEDLENAKFRFFLDLWKDADGSVLDIEDKTPLYVSNEENFVVYNKVEVSESQSDLYDQLEDNSMRQKEAILSSVTFFLEKNHEVEGKEHDDIRTVLKAIFQTSKENFSPLQVKKILSQYGEAITSEASTSLIKDKELFYYGSDEQGDRFVLADKVLNTLTVRLTTKFLEAAAHFQDNIFSIFQASKGLILSQGIQSGQVASLLHLISDRTASLAHIDKAYKFEGYESRLIDKEKLSCDIVVYQDKKLDERGVCKVAVPAGKACSHFWLDLNGNINDEVWRKIIVAVLYNVHFRPGIPLHQLHYRLQTVLGVRDFKAVIKWLTDCNCITSGPSDGIWVTREWYSILGF
ncbi:RNA polymerase III transcription factor [Scheffersomyces xylosifermentans]|uniref:RNA polymerase III transcription factor n=1 Tax=Scheffersomyces xylosifermentans TaxID=1304137 RepID=UPI00315CE3B8